LLHSHPIYLPSEARNTTSSAAVFQEAGALLDKAIEQCIIPDFGKRAWAYLLMQVALRPSTTLVDLVVLIDTLDVKTLIAHDKVMVVLEHEGRVGDTP